MAGSRSMAERALTWSILAAVVAVVATATLDAWRSVGRPDPGFAVMANGAVGIGGLPTGGLEPFDLIVAIEGRPVGSGPEIHAEVARHEKGTSLRYTVQRGSRLVDVQVPTRRVTMRDFKRFLLEGLQPALLLLGLGALVTALRPGLPDSRLFLAYCVLMATVDATYRDANTLYRFSRLFLTAWTLLPAVLMHLALVFPERRSVARRHPRVILLPYVLAVAVSVSLHALFHRGSAGLAAAVVAAGYWCSAFVLLVLSLLRTSLAGPTALVRQRARVLTAGFAVSYLIPVLGTSIEAVFKVSVPSLNLMWKLGFLFPVAVAYAIVRYGLFDIRAVVRLGTIYSLVTALIAVAYAGALTLLGVSFAWLDLSVSPVVPAAVVSLAVVLFVNPVYTRAQELVDRTFFRQRYDAQLALERLAAALTTVHALDRVVALIASTVEDLLHPVRLRLLLADDACQEFRSPDPRDRGAVLPAESAIGRALDAARTALTRDRIEADPTLAGLRQRCLGEMEGAGAEVVVPILFRDRLRGIVLLGAKRSGAAYTDEDLRLLRAVTAQSVLALEHARAYAALQAALRRVEILESIRSSLSKFVPRTVQELIERAPEAPDLAKQDLDVSVLFVDIAGYTRLSERLDGAAVTRLVERYFGAFLDEILARGGDVNETAGDGLMVIFQDADPARHAEAAVDTALAIVRRARAINTQVEQGAEPIELHLGVNSGVAAVGATKIEGTAGTRWTYTASGSVTNVAARLAAMSHGDAVLLGAETRRRLGPGHAVDDLGEQALRNVEGPVHVYRVSVPHAVPRATAA